MALLQQSATASLVVVLSRDHYVLSGEVAPARLGSVFLRGVLSNVLDLEGVLFFLACLPQFANPAAGGAVPQLLVPGLTFALLAWLTGSVPTGLGIRLALPEGR